MQSQKNSLRNAALVIKNLAHDQAEQVLARLDSHDVRTVFQAINELDQVTAKQVFDALDQLARECQQASQTNGQFGAAAAPVAQAADDPLHTEAHRRSPLFFLAQTDPQLVTQLIADEHPADIALILAQLPPHPAAVQIRSLDGVLRVSVLKRMCQLEKIDANRSGELAYDLKIRLHKVITRTTTKPDGISAAVKLLNFVDTDTRQEMLDHLQQSDPDAVREISTGIMQFADLEKIADSDMKLLLRHVDTSCWAPAMKHAPLGLCKKILGNMASKPAKILTREMQALGYVDKHIATHAQQQILAAYLRLAEVRN